jgi:hypothetical protein
MMVQVVGILMPYLAFLMLYNHSNPQHVGDHAWPCYKNMKCIQNFVGNSIVAEIIVKSDVKIVCPLLLLVYNHLNLVKEPT